MFFIFFLVIQTILFFLDMCLTALFSLPLFPCTIAGLLIGCYATLTYAESVFLLLPALLHGLFLYGITGAFLYLFIAALLATRWALQHVQHQQILLTSLMSGYWLYSLYQAHNMISLGGLIAYTILIFGGIFTLMNFSLKWLIAVKRGNRL